MADAYAAQLGGWPALTAMQTAAIRRAAELTALAEQARAEALRNAVFDPLALSRLEGCADRARRALQLGQREPQRQTFREKLIAESEQA